MLERLLELSKKVESVEPTAHCQVDGYGCQIIVRFDKRPDVEIALLTPMTQMEIRKGAISDDILTDMLFSVKRIANNSILQAGL